MLLKKRVPILLFPIILVLLSTSMTVTVPPVVEATTADVEILSHSSYIRYESYIETYSKRRYRGDFLHIVGELQNVGEENIELLEVNATYYDEDGEAIEGPKLWVLWLEILPPRQKAPFATVLLDEEASEKVASYTLSIVHEATTEELYQDLEIPSYTQYDESDPVKRWYQHGVVGEVRNMGMENIEDVRIFATVYDDDGTVIGWYSKGAEIGVLVPGQASPFEVPFVDPTYGYFPKDVTGRINSYQLYPSCTVSDKIPYRAFQITSQSHKEEWEYQTWKYTVEGEVKNTGGQDASNVVVEAMFYDDNGEVIDITMDYIDSLEAGGKAPFEIGLAADAEVGITGYSLQVECWEYDVKQASEISCSVSPSIIFGDEVEVAGSVTPPHTGVAVTLRYTRPDGTTFLRNTTTASGGSYRDAFQTDSVGSWSVTASWTGDEDTKGASQMRSFTVEKISSSISLSLSPKKVSEGETITASGSLEPSKKGATITLTLMKPDGATYMKTVQTASDGSYSYTLKPEDAGEWRVKASWPGDEGHGEAASSVSTFTVREKGLCIIATATYSSELAPEVQFLRGFRDNKVLSTFAGSLFMRAFNAWYYSFSPGVAAFIAEHHALRSFMKASLHPLIGILHTAAFVYGVCGFHGEVSILMAGLVASSLIGVIYLSPPLGVLFLTFKRIEEAFKAKGVKLLSTAWVAGFVFIVIGEVGHSPPIMICATVVFVLSTLILSGTIGATGIVKAYSKWKRLNVFSRHP